jgi:hypothetical protein
MDVSENARLLWKKICLQSRYKFKSLQLLTILESDLLQIIVSLNLSLEGESDSKKQNFPLATAYASRGRLMQHQLRALLEDRASPSETCCARSNHLCFRRLAKR